jgi:integrase
MLKKRINMGIPASEPKLWDRKGNIKAEWCVGFYYTDPRSGERKPVQVRRGINEYKTKPERREYAQGLIELVADALNEGWNPFMVDFETFYIQWVQMAQLMAEAGQQAPELIDITALSYDKKPFNEALEFALDQRAPNLKPQSLKAYTTIATFAMAAAEKIGGKVKLSELPVSQVRRPHIKMLLTQMQKDREAAYKEEYEQKVAREAEMVRTKRKDYKSRTFKLQKFTGNNYNKYKETLYTLFSELETNDAVEYNPCSKIPSKPEIDTNKHRHPSAKEERKIKDHLRVNDIRLYIFLAFEELAGMRPNEILSLRIIDIDWFDQWFDLSEEDSKTRTARKVPIPNALVPLIKLLNLEKHPNPNDYIFSENLLPGPRRIKRDKVTKRWGKRVHKDLGIYVTCYSFKGLGADKKIEAGIQKKVVSKESLGHTNVRTTDIYLELEDERNRRDIVENTPEF